MPAGHRPRFDADVIVIGAGAAGLMAAIHVGRSPARPRVIALDGAAKLGAKILVAGGGRCNVTHDEVTVQAYAGSSRKAIERVLRRFDVPQTVAFFAQLGVQLKREETGKLFPTTDSARTVLDALLHAARAAGVLLSHPARVETLDRQADHFVVGGAWGRLTAPRVVLATGGKSLPKSGSDGFGYALARSLGHTVTPRVLPALVPLTLPRDHWICALSGITVPAMLMLHSPTVKVLAAYTDSTLCTHFGLSGPSVLDISRHYLYAHADDPAVTLAIRWLPDHTPDEFERQVMALGRGTVLRHLTERLPERLARALIDAAGLDMAATGDHLPREARRRLVETVMACPLPVTGNRGYTYAEVTAGGIPLAEVRLDTMESRPCPGLYLCGEICDVDGRIGGYNFQWAWASGYVAGLSAGDLPPVMPALTP